MYADVLITTKVPEPIEGAIMTAAELLGTGVPADSEYLKALTEFISNHYPWQLAPGQSIDYQDKKEVIQALLQEAALELEG